MRFLKTILVEMVIASLLKRFIRLLDFLTWHSWDVSYLIMMCNSFNTLLVSVC
jgi:hypothetical protein